VDSKKTRWEAGMVWQTRIKAVNDSSTTKQINVTDLTCSQRRELFRDCLNQAGFIGFIKS
jgi:hypothetical protein